MKNVRASRILPMVTVVSAKKEVQVIGLKCPAFSSLGSKPTEATTFAERRG